MSGGCSVATTRASGFGGSYGANRAARVLAGIYFALVTICMASLAHINAIGHDPWAVGDWLINYQGGFVRRGLLGELAYRAQHGLHLSSPVVLVVSFQLAVYAVLLLATWRLLNQSSWAFWIKAFVVSPATLTFPVFDQLGGFRKEILLLAGLAVLILLLRNRHLHPGLISLYMAAMAVLLVLAHEASLLYLPYWFAAVAISYRNLRQALLTMLPSVVLGALCWCAAVTHPGTPVTAQRVCASVGGRATGLCNGAIAALAQSPAEAHQQVVVMVSMYHPIARYAGLAFLALLPAFVAGAVLWRVRAVRRQVQYVAVASLLSFALTSVLFLYAVDWGRWIYIHAFCLFLVLLCIDRDREVQAASVPTGASTGASAWAIIGLVLFMTTWKLPRIPGSLPAIYAHHDLGLP